MKHKSLYNQQSKHLRLHLPWQWWTLELVYIAPGPAMRWESVWNSYKMVYDSNFSTFWVVLTLSYHPFTFFCYVFPSISSLPEGRWVWKGSYLIEYGVLLTCSASCNDLIASTTAPSTNSLYETREISARQWSIQSPSLVWSIKNMYSASPLEPLVSRGPNSYS